MFHCHVILGLTTEEIDVAMARVGVVEGDTPVPVAPVPGGAAVQPPGMYVAGYQPGLPPHAQPGYTFITHLNL